MTKEEANIFEKAHVKSHLAMIKMYASDYENQGQDSNLWPLLVTNDLAKKLPMTLVTTREFDRFRQDSAEYAELLDKNGRLLTDLYIYPGTPHEATYNGESDESKDFNAASKKLFDTFI